MTKIALVPEQAPAFISSGLTGATSASRYVGATTTGAPSSGTFVTGDFVVARDGKLWICTTGGSPGTWSSDAYTSGTGITVTGNSVALTVPVAVTSGGTGGITALAARTSLNVPQRGFAADLGALTAGTGLDVVHSLGTLDVVIQVYRKSDGDTVTIGTLRKDTNTITVTSDVNVLTGVLRVVVEPIT